MNCNNGIINALEMCHKIFQFSSLSTHYLLTIYSLSAHYLLIIYSLSTHCVPVCDVVDPAADGCLLPDLHRLVLQTSQWHRLLIRGGSMKGFWRLYKPVRSTGQCGGCRSAAAAPPRAPGPRPELRRCEALWRQEQTWRRCLTISSKGRYVHAKRRYFQWNVSI